MTIVTNDYFLMRIQAIIDRLSISTPGKRQWVEDSSCDNGYDYGATIRSTFPEYIKFAYVKKPRNYHLLSEDEQNEYFGTNTRDLLITLNSIKKGKKIRTKNRQRLLSILFYNFRVEELDFYEQYQENMFN